MKSAIFSINPDKLLAGFGEIEKVNKESERVSKVFNRVTSTRFDKRRPDKALEDIEFLLNNPQLVAEMIVNNQGSIISQSVANATWDKTGHRRML